MLQRTNIYLEPEDLSFLKETAYLENTTMSHVVRQYIKEKKEKKMQKPTPYDSIMKLIELGKDTPRSRTKSRDGALNHDYYIYIKPFEQRKKEV